MPANDVKAIIISYKNYEKLCYFIICFTKKKGNLVWLEGRKHCPEEFFSITFPQFRLHELAFQCGPDLTIYITLKGFLNFRVKFKCFS